MRPRKSNSRKTRKSKGPAYRSKLEERVGQQLSLLKANYEFEPDDKKIQYTKPASFHKYLPDFVVVKSDKSRMYIEAKGIWDFDDRHKHLLIRQQHPELDVRFVFQRAANKIRKGSKSSYADICNGLGRGIFKGVEWKFGDNGKIPRSWLDE